jgi:hypothetical protein
MKIMEVALNFELLFFTGFIFGPTHLVTLISVRVKRDQLSNA